MQIVRIYWEEYFLRELDIIPVQGFLVFNFIPPSLRRHIEILRRIQKRDLIFYLPSFSFHCLGGPRISLNHEE